MFRPSTPLSVTLLAASTVLLTGAASSGVLAALTELQPLIGEPVVVSVQPGQTLLDIAFDHRLGFEQVARLNPDVDVWVPESGTQVKLPTEWILPDVPREGLVINIPEMRVYDFTRGEDPEVFAVAVGDRADPTPVGEFRVGAKRVDPVWNVPVSIRAERPELPAQVPPGDANPLGRYWMTIGRTSYGIHGTNIRWSIGRMATHGCVRLYNDEMESLYERIEPGTLVRIVYEPVKIGQRGDGVFVEAHPDVYLRQRKPVEDALFRLFLLGNLGRLDAASIDRKRLEEAIAEARGVPVRIASAPALAGD